MKKEIKAKEKKNRLIYDPYCPRCDVWRTDTERSRMNFCPDCVEKFIKQSDCLICGKPMDGHWKYCANCGIEIVI